MEHKMKLRITEKSTFKEVLERFQEIRNTYPEDSSIYQNAKYAFGVYVAAQNKLAMGRMSWKS
jgi:hypothetical protein